jgi:hypothetical protein
VQVAESTVEDLAAVQDDVALKLSLWTSSAEFEDVVAGWRGCHFDALDLASMEETVARWAADAVKHTRRSYCTSALLNCRGQQLLSNTHVIYTAHQTYPTAVDTCSTDSPRIRSTLAGTMPCHASTRNMYLHTMQWHLNSSAMPHCRFHKSVFKMEKGVPPNKLVPKLRAAVDEYRLLLPVVSALRNKALKERHWTKVFAAIGATLQRDETFTLQVCAQSSAALCSQHNCGSTGAQDPCNSSSC